MRTAIVAAAVIVCLGAAGPVRAQNTPVAHEVHLTTSMGTAASGTLDATDPDGDPLTFTIVAPPIKGIVVLTDAHTGAFLYTPNPLQNGADMFTFQASDGTSTSVPARVSIRIVEAHPGNIAIGKRAVASAPGGIVPAPALVDGDLTTSWTSDPAATGSVSVGVNLGEAKRIWRAVIHWAPGRFASTYDISQGNVLFSTNHATGGVDDVVFAATEASTIFRLDIARVPSEAGRIYEIQEIELYETETENHVSRNPPPTAADRFDATTYGPLTDGDAGTGVTIAFPGEPLQFEITSTFPSPVITRIVLFWGDTYATHYQVIASGSCIIESLVLDKTDGRGGVEVIDLPGPVDSSCVKLQFLDGPAATFELREVEMYGPFPDDIALGRPTVASSSGSAAGVDGDPTTEWNSGPSTDPVWFLVDVGTLSKPFPCGIRIGWGTKFAQRYAIFILADGDTTFVPYAATDQGDGGLDFTGGQVFHPARYYVLVMPPSDVGYTIRDFAVFSCPLSTS